MPRPPRNATKKVGLARKCFPSKVGGKVAVTVDVTAAAAAAAAVVVTAAAWGFVFLEQDPNEVTLVHT